MLSRIASVACKKIAFGGRTAIKSIASRPTTPFVALGSTTATIRQFSSVKLADALTKEIAAEKEAVAAEEIDADAEEVKIAILKKFKIQESDGKGTIILTSTVNGENVEVKFDVQDEDEDEPDYENEEEEPEEEEEAEESVGYNFHVKVSKASGDSIIAYCFAGKDLRIQNLRFLPAGASKEDDTLYGGPPFTTLDDSLQESFRTYFESLGVDDDMRYFILSYSRTKESNEYALWLSKLQKFVSSK